MMLQRYVKHFKMNIYKLATPGNKNQTLYQKQKKLHLSEFKKNDSFFLNYKLLKYKKIYLFIKKIKNKIYILYK